MIAVNNRIQDSGGDSFLIAMKTHDEIYAFVYDAASRPELLRLLGRFAVNPDLSFNWHDAALMSKKIREAGVAASYGGLL